MTHIEIIEKLKTIYDSVDDFVMDVQCYDFEKYPEALRAQNERKEFREKFWIPKQPISEEISKAYKDLPNEYEIVNKLYRLELGLLWEEVESCNDCDDYYTVFYFPEYDIYIKISGHQTGGDVEYNGWDACEEVKPIQKTYTVYEKSN